MVYLDKVLKLLGLLHILPIDILDLRMVQHQIHNLLHHDLHTLLLYTIYTYDLHSIMFQVRNMFRL